MNREITNHIEIGTRIHSILYGGRDGIVYAIHGKQTPESVRLFCGGAMAMGGSANFDIVFDNGTETRGLPECILRGVQWRIYAEIARPEEIAFLREHCASETERKRIEAEDAAKKFAAEVAALRVDPRYAKLKQLGDNHGGGKHVAVNLRIELKAAFPGVKFSIRSDYDTVRIGWVDGPTIDEVKNLTGKYEAGHFDGMDDSYHYQRSPFTQVYGDVKYVFETRNHSVAAITAAAAVIKKMYDCEDFKVTAYSDGSAYVSCNNHDDQRHVYDYLERRYPFNEGEII